MKISLSKQARSANERALRNLGVQVVQLDYNKPGTLFAALRDVDKLFLQATQKLTINVDSSHEVASSLVVPLPLSTVITSKNWYGDLNKKQRAIS